METQKKRKLRAGTYTVCLDTQKADPDTYMNWVTFRLTRLGRNHYNVTRKSNVGGNGQTWDECGTIQSGCFYLLRIETQMERMVVLGDATDSLSVMAGTVLARYFGLYYNRSVCVSFPKARVFRPVGRKTAAPSLLRANVRDKNVDQMRANVGGGFMARDGGTNPLLEGRV